MNLSFTRFLSRITMFMAVLQSSMVGFNVSAQESDSVSSSMNEVSTPSPILKYFLDLEVLSTAPDNWEFISEDQVEYLYNENRHKGSMSTYKHPSGKFVSQIKVDNNNYIWFWTKTKENQITGETEPIAAWTDNIYCFKRMFGEVGAFYLNSNKGRISVYCNLDPDNEYALECPDSKMANFYLWAGTNLDKIKGQMYETAIGAVPYAYHYKSKEEASKVGNGWRMLSTYGDREVEFKLYPYENKDDTWSLRFMTEVDGHAVEAFPKKDYITLRYFITPDDYVQLSTKDVVTSIEQQGNVFDIKLEHPCDFLKYSIYAHNVFDGKLTRKNGYFNMKNDQPKDGTFVSYYTSEPLQLEHYNPDYPSQKLGVISIPAGIHCIELNANNDLLSNYDSNREIFFNNNYAKSGIWFYDDSGEHILSTYFAGTVFHKDGVRIAREQEASLTAKIIKEEETALAPLKQKYGASNVEAVRKGSIKVGMPWALLKEAFPYSTMDDSSNYAVYRVWNNKPQIDRTNKKFAKVNMGFGQLVYVTVRNGMVTDLYFSGHK